jgi:maltose alpha-D-glucosyltransferase/alpha-amylase
VLIDDFGVLKIYRTLQDGIHPEIEMTRYLTEAAGFTATPPLLGTIEWLAEDGSATAAGVLSLYLVNQGDAWSSVQAYLRRSFENAPLPAAPVPGEEPIDPHVFFLRMAALLGRRTAELHRALCPDPATAEPAFAPEPIGPEDLARWRDGIREDAGTVLAALEARLAADQSLDAGTVALGRRLLEAKGRILARIDAAGSHPVVAVKTRYHGDYHLGQVLVVQNDFSIIDFEGEPRRPIEQRRQKHSALKDVAGMLRSIDYAAGAALKAAIGMPAADREAFERFCHDWRSRATGCFLEGYRTAIAGSPVWPDDDRAARDLLDLLTLEKALYEIGYELANRPSWISIPIQGVLDLVSNLRSDR